MKDYIQSSMKVGIVHFMAFPGAVNNGELLLKTIERVAADSFFDAIEITSIPDPALRQQVAQLLALSGITVGYAAQPAVLNQGLNLNSPEAAQRQKAIAAIKAGLEEARQLGARRLALLSGPDPGEDKRKAAQHLLVDSLTELCHHAQQLGSMEVVLEAFDRAVDKRSLIGPAQEAAEIAREVRRLGCPNFGLLLDLSHLPLLHEDIWTAVAAAAPYLLHVHIGNCVVRHPQHPSYGDKHPPFGIPEGENGVPQVREFLRALRESGYLREGSRPIVAFEVKPMGNESPELVIAGAKRTLLQAWAEVRV